MIVFIFVKQRVTHCELKYKLSQSVNAGITHTYAHARTHTHIYIAFSMLIVFYQWNTMTRST